MKGKGARLFAKRQAKSESWTVSGDDDIDDDATTTSAEPSASVQQKLSAEHRPRDEQVPDQQPAVPPVNRLKAMTELARPAMSPWDAAAKYGTVDPAFAHLSAADASTTSGTGRVKSWSGDQDAAAAS